MADEYITIGDYLHAGFRVTMQDGSHEDHFDVVMHVGGSGALHIQRSLMQLPEDQRPNWASLGDVFTLRVIPPGSWKAVDRVQRPKT